MKTINYTGSSKLISRIVHLLNRKAPLPLNGDGDAVWGTNGQVLTTDGQGNTYWGDGGGGGDVTDVEVNGTSVVNAQGVAEVSVPTALSALSEDSTHRVVTDTEKTTWNGKVSDNPTFTEAATRANIASGESFATILGKIKKFFADLKTVAFTGNYSDLSGTPTIPTVNDGTLTIQQNGTTLGTFTANQSGNTIVNLSGGGHVIEDQDGTDMTQRANLQFADAHLTDDSVNDRTEVEVIEEVTAQGWEDATEDGLYSVDGGSSFVPITGAEIGYDANTSINQKIDDVENSLVYKAGDTINISNDFHFGFATGTQQIYLKIYLPKPVSATSFSISVPTGEQIAIRPSNNNFIMLTPETFTSKEIHPTGIAFYVRTTTVHNVPLATTISAAFTSATITFS